MRYLGLLVWLVACNGDVSVSKVPVDADNDGFDEEVDCDDGHAVVNPDAPEVCDGLDNDCDGVVDDDPDDGATFYTDADDDGAGDPDAPVVACEAPADAVTTDDDCDDAEARAFPGNAEVCDEVDNDCDTAIDEDDASDVATWYADTDGDSYGDAAIAVTGCAAPEGYVADGTDCDDAVATIHPDAAETDCGDATDYNCDGSVAYADADGDGVPACEDCDDTDAGRSPARSEVCDDADRDEDCSGAADDADAGVSDATTWGRDIDGDGYADAAGATLVQCDAPAGYAAATGDCDDYDARAYPGASEVCDPEDVDEDCSGAADDADPGVDPSTWVTWYRDADADTFGDATRSVSLCDAVAGYVADAADCDDTTAFVSPAGAEVCDAADVDEDCDGLVDDADPSVTGGAAWYTDGDGDGYGGATTRTACDAPADSVANTDDCDDGTAGVSPAAAEVCDAADVDEDCDGLADDADASATGGATWYRDADGDGYGEPATITAACSAPAGYVADDTDCDDEAEDAYPGGTEVCDDGIDQDCDGYDTSCPFVGPLDPADADIAIYGLATNDTLGEGLTAGDFDGDGIGDLVVGAPRQTVSTNTGIVYGYYGPLVLGAQPATANDDFDYYNRSDDYDDRYGEDLANLGDLNDDGKDDLRIYTNGRNHGFYGGDTGSTEFSRYDFYQTCTSAAAGGDFDAPTGRDEWVCGYTTPTVGRGEARIYTSGSTLHATLTGESSYDAAGSGVGGGGDVDGDGYDDVAVGAYGYGVGASTVHGAVYLVYGPVSGTFGLGSADARMVGRDNERLGIHVSIPGDIDGDGRDDIIATGPYSDAGATDAGAVYVVTDPTGGEIADVASITILGEAASDYLGGNSEVDGCVPAVGDFDADGRLDLVVSTSWSDGGGASDVGGVWLFYAPGAGTRSVAGADATWYGESIDRLGASIVAVPDTNGDGSDELAMAATYATSTSASAMYTGVVWVWLGE